MSSEKIQELVITSATFLIHLHENLYLYKSNKPIKH